MKAVIFVTLKPSVFDPQGEAVRQAMAAHGLESVQSVRIGKRIEVEMKEAGARAKLERICSELLSNPVIENYELIMEGESQSGIPKPVKPPVKKIAAKKTSAPARKSAAAARGVVPPKPVKPPVSSTTKTAASKTTKSSTTKAATAKKTAQPGAKQAPAKDDKAKEKAEKKLAKEAKKAAKKEKKAAKKLKKAAKKAAKNKPSADASAS